MNISLEFFAGAKSECLAYLKSDYIGGQLEQVLHQLARSLQSSGLTKACSYIYQSPI